MSSCGISCLLIKPVIIGRKYFLEEKFFIVVFNVRTSIAKKNILRLPVPVRREENEVGGGTWPFHLITFPEVPGVYLNSVAGAVEDFLQVCFFLL